jgi:hypothetical protein
MIKNKEYNMYKWLFNCFLFVFICHNFCLVQANETLKNESCELMQTPKIAVLAVTEDDQVMLNCHFHPATESWEIELPRSGIVLGQTPETAAFCLVEKNGMVTGDLIALAEIPLEDFNHTFIYVGNFIKQQSFRPEEVEMSGKLFYLTISEIKQAFAKGYYEHTIEGDTKNVSFRDPFLAYAILMYEFQQKS